jgi:hypothetical protein
VSQERPFGTLTPVWCRLYDRGAARAFLAGFPAEEHEAWDVARDALRESAELALVGCTDEAANRWTAVTDGKVAADFVKRFALEQMRVELPGWPDDWEVPS